MNNILKQTLIHAGVGIGVGTVIGIAREVKPLIRDIRELKNDKKIYQHSLSSEDSDLMDVCEDVYEASQHVVKQNLKYAAIRTAKLAAVTGGIGVISGAISGAFTKLKLEAVECNLEDFGIDPNTLI